MSKTLEDFQKQAAEAAAVFFQRCRFQTHIGSYDCEDKFVIYFTRDGGLAELFRLTLPLEWTTAVGQTPEGSGSACLIYNYGRDIDPIRVSKLLERFYWARLNAHQDDAWIIEHAEELKAALLDLDKSGSPRPDKGTLLGRALELFTNDE